MFYKAYVQTSKRFEDWELWPGSHERSWTQVDHDLPGTVGLTPTPAKQDANE